MEGRTGCMTAGRSTPIFVLCRRLTGPVRAQRGCALTDMPVFLMVDLHGASKARPRDGIEPYVQNISSNSSWVNGGSGHEICCREGRFMIQQGDAPVTPWVWRMGRPSRPCRPCIPIGWLLDVLLRHHVPWQWPIKGQEGIFGPQCRVGPS